MVGELKSSQCMPLIMWCDGLVCPVNSQGFRFTSGPIPMACIRSRPTRLISSIFASRNSRQSVYPKSGLLAAILDNVSPDCTV